MLAHGYDQEGLKWAQKILVEHPGHRETCLVLADYYERIGDWELAKSYRNQVVQHRLGPLVRRNRLHGFSENLAWLSLQA